MHFEDRCHSKNTCDTFAILASAFGDEFCLGHNTGRNLARLVVLDLLKWRTGADFYADIAAVTSAEVQSA